jgi:N-acetylmuramoyl-L-alanine amidase
MPEKDVTLVFARRLRQELASRSISARLLRDGDVTLTADQRAEAVNGLRPALYLVVHATSLGRGLRLYTALLPEGSGDHRPFLNWQTAQASALGRSQAIKEQISQSLQRTSAQALSLSAALRPLSNVAVPAVAVEVAPAAADVSQLASTDYQQRVCSALANAIASAAPMLTAHASVPQ